MKVVCIFLIAIFSGMSIYGLWVEKLRMVGSSLIFTYLSYMGLILLGYKNVKSKHIDEKGLDGDKEIKP